MGFKDAGAPWASGYHHWKTFLHLWQLLHRWTSMLLFDEKGITASPEIGVCCTLGLYISICRDFLLLFAELCISWLSTTCSFSSSLEYMDLMFILFHSLVCRIGAGRNNEGPVCYSRLSAWPSWVSTNTLFLTRLPPRLSRAQSLHCINLYHLQASLFSLSSKIPS